MFGHITLSILYWKIVTANGEWFEIRQIAYTNVNRRILCLTGNINLKHPERKLILF